MLPWTAIPTVLPTGPWFIPGHSAGGSLQRQEAWDPLPEVLLLPLLQHLLGNGEGASPIDNAELACGPF